MFEPINVIGFGVLVAASAVVVAAGFGQARSQAQAPAQMREITITVENGRYSPARVIVAQGEKVRLQFLRKEHNACTKEVVFPTLGIRRELPPDEPVYIDLPVLEVGETGFQCGMGMVEGLVLVQAR